MAIRKILLTLKLNHQGYLSATKLFSKMNYQRLIDKIQDHVLKYYKNNDTSNLTYHNQKHTEHVVEAATEIAGHYELSEHDLFIVLAAVWFHDIGYITNTANHEEEGYKLAEIFLAAHKVNSEDIQLIKGCIMATKMPQSATTLIEQIVCDADLFQLGTDDLFKNDKLLRKEYNSMHQTDINKLEWKKKTISFLEKHTYYTNYCKLLLNDKKKENLEILKEKVLTEESKIIQPADEIETQNTEEAPADNKKKSDKKDKPDKGIETMFRISSSNHQRLSDMADRKAHIMITVNSIILSAIISLVFRRLDTYGYLVVPSFILLLVSVTAMTFSILSTRPSIPKGIFSKEDVDEKRTNLLFFGNFYKMKLDDFNYGMQKMMIEKDFLYGSLIRDVYAQGVVLGKKYHLLRIAYNVFMFGLIVSVAAFIIAFLFFNKGR